MFKICTSRSDFVISYDNTDLETAERYTQVMKLSRNEIKRRQVEGFYKDVPITVNQGATQTTNGVVEQTMERLEGMSSVYV